MVVVGVQGEGRNKLSACQYLRRPSWSAFQGSCLAILYTEDMHIIIAIGVALILKSLSLVGCAVGLNPPPSYSVKYLLFACSNLQCLFDSLELYNLHYLVPTLHYILASTKMIKSEVNI